MKSKEFTPTYMKNDEYWNEFKNNNDQINESYNMGISNLFEMSMYQLINEKFSMYSNHSYHSPYDVSIYSKLNMQESDQYENFSHHQTLAKSKSMPTEDVSSDINQDINLTFDQSEINESKIAISHFIAHNENYVDESSFYEKLDNEIIKFVENVEKQLASVSEEREILCNLFHIHN